MKESGIISNSVPVSRPGLTRRELWRDGEGSAAQWAHFWVPSCVFKQLLAHEHFSYTYCSLQHFECVASLSFSCLLHLNSQTAAAWLRACSRVCVRACVRACVRNPERERKEACARARQLELRFSVTFAKKKDSLLFPGQEFFVLLSFGLRVHLHCSVSPVTPEASLWCTMWCWWACQKLR